ncbi:hypothetical protein AKJ52_01065 [candidate division MSBL1 archaeon SCGC-AAA382C18]|uniref:Endonuclease NucS n=1 Tax=candidate division MSBL1 archaeon SCGC-AAA382C18 TaxID=1698281 RepID=A0A133VKU6_9EURY|nr:hypothetical protein AKJ52_01065 [candidate division MSBL1 archaeon SCGC-AAA382C18]
MQILKNPSLKSGKEFIDKSLQDENSIILVGSCVAKYSGRAGSFLPEGERIIIIKPDGTLLVHQNEKREPVNWNPPGCTASVSLDQDLRLVSERSDPEETLLVIYKNLKMAASFELMDEQELELVGTEEDLVKSVLQNPELVEDGFKPKEREKPVSSGVIDIYGEDREGNGVALEFKRGKASLSAVNQLSRYVRELENKVNRKVRGIVVAPEISSGAKNLLTSEGLEYVKVEQFSSFDEIIYERGQKKIKEFMTENDADSERS